MKNAAISEIPEHLKPFTTEQNADLYTPIDHAGWRFIMYISADFFADKAHPIYLEGLKATGISLERIPLVSEMDAALRKFGWRAATVSGFIPPAAFLEFLENGILPIACEMRKVENLNYTPAPDIVHEAAGHAPILADQEYADYVKAYGSIASKAIYSQKDLLLYEVIRRLSDIKEKPDSTPEDIEIAQKDFEKAYGDLDYVSEATQLARMSWWTIEYGLIGDLNKPYIYGAGLLSSLGESFHCFDDAVKKVPLSYDCIHQSYDITRPQPQLFVSPDIESMKRVLIDYAKTMAYQVGGTYALGKAKHAGSPVTTVLDTGLQITGTLRNFSCNQKDEPTFLNIKGPLQFSFDSKELENWKTADLPEKILAPVGTPTAFTLNGQAQKNWDLFDFSRVSGQDLEATFASGIKICGRISGCEKRNGKNLFVTVENFQFHCPYEKTQYKLSQSFILFGHKVPSVFGGAADRVAFLNATQDKVYVSNDHKTNYDQTRIQDLISAYAEVRSFREGQKPDPQKLEDIVKFLDCKYPKDWLLRWELLELNTAFDLRATWETKLRTRLGELMNETPQSKELIQRGMNYLEKKGMQKSAIA